jgi:hypothetical protein
MSGTSDNDHIVAKETMHGYDLDATFDAVGATAPEIDPIIDWSELIGNQELSDTLLLDGEHSSMSLQCPRSPWQSKPA